MPERPTLETERLILRPFDISDAKDVQRLAGDKAIADTTLNLPHPYEDGMAESWISVHQEHFDKSESVNFAIALKSEAALIGAIGLMGLSARHQRAEMGYWIGKPYWGKGYATEAAAAALRFGFIALGLNRIFACYFDRNPASGRVLEKIGMKPEGMQRQHVERWGKFEDLHLFGILRAEWEEIDPGTHFALGGSKK